MSHEQTDPADQSSRLRRDDGEDRILAALDFLRGVLSASGDSHWQGDTARQKSGLKKWAQDLGLVLDSESILPLLRKGGQKHDYYFDPIADRCVKLTRSGVFGLTPGIELALVPADQDARRFHLWEASPWQYLERLRLQNLITPGLNRLEGVIVQDDDLAICISQPRFEIIAVTQGEIDSWFVSRGFQIVTAAAYYREEDNLGVFDAHDKNVVRSPIDSGTLIPFDVIPVLPDGGFLEFIRQTLLRGESVSVRRTSRTKTRARD